MIISLIRYRARTWIDRECHETTELLTEYKTKKTTKTVALAKLMKYCAYQERCHMEVRQKLLSLGMRSADLEEIMAELIEQNFLNEERFARSFSRGKFRLKQWGRNKITAELEKRRISSYCIRSGLREIGEEDYHRTLLDLIRKKSLQVKTDDPYQKKDKIARYAIRKGFEPDLVWRILKSDNI